MIELAEIFRRYGSAYRAKFGHAMPPSHTQVMRAIEQCRTPALGGHVYACPDCGETRYVYHSCRRLPADRILSLRGPDLTEQYPHPAAARSCTI